MAETPCWTPEDELAYQIAFDKPLYRRPDKPKRPCPTKPIVKTPQPGLKKKHIIKEQKNEKP